MDAPAVLNHLITIGCPVFLREGQLIVRDTQHVLTDDVRASIRTHRDALVTLLTPAPRALTPYYPCVVCGSTDRYEDHGIWRCEHCWPTGSVRERRGKAA
jgi:hypothetical protein